MEISLSVTVHMLLIQNFNSNNNDVYIVKCSCIAKGIPGKLSPTKMLAKDRYNVIEQSSVS